MWNIKRYNAMIRYMIYDTIRYNDIWYDIGYDVILRNLKRYGIKWDDMTWYDTR